MKKQRLPAAFLKAIEGVKNKRAKIVLDHIVKYGFVTTEELGTKYNYNDEARMRMDAVNLGFPIVSTWVKSTEGRSIVAYSFGDVETFGKIATGRRRFPKHFKAKLISEFGSKCNICSGIFEARYLQIDHRVPFGILGEVKGELLLADFQLLCGSCNRAKSWSCEHCENLLSKKEPGICVKCYWGSPEGYEHIAMEKARRLDLLWRGKEVQDFVAMKKVASGEGIELPIYVKRALKARNK